MRRGSSRRFINRVDAAGNYADAMARQSGFTRLGLGYRL